MSRHEKTTVPGPSVGTDGEQPHFKETNGSITEKITENKSQEALFQRLRDLHNPNYLHTMTLDELYDTVFESSPPLVEGLLRLGTYLFVGAPKLGKSFLVTQIAYHVSTGTEFWGMKVQKGTVLYLALEDDYTRLQSRLYRMFGTEGTDRLFFSVGAKSLDDGLEGQMEKFISDHPDTRLIIIDTLQKIRDSNTEQYSYGKDYTLISRLKQFAGNHQICLLLVHHTRKQQADDKFDMISGSNGLMGAADGAMLLQKEKRTAMTATLDISGRDQQDQRFYLRRDEARLTWELDHVEQELWREAADPLLEAVAKLLSEPESCWKGSATALASELETEISPVGLTKKLNVNAQRLRKEHQIIYTWNRGHNGRVITLQRKLSEA